ncbi:MAG: carboxypeptidase regulatory-like domain-containing protein, partial [bacterium]|nr:carboxypeptidase regulatory-like domain-containing protein [bacterium]
MKKVITSALVVIACLGFWGCSKNEIPPAVVTTGTISGVVTDSASDTAIAGAGIATIPATSSVTANTPGQFSITGVKAGTYTVTASKTGYVSKSISVAVNAGNAVTANISLVASGSTMAIVWVSIPAGSFTMGSTAADTVPWYNTAGDEYPQHTVYLDAYQISKYEVTNSQFKAFMDAGGYSDSTYWTTDGWAWRTANSIT